MFIFFILFIIVGAMVYYWSKEFYISQTKESLITNLNIISFELDQNPKLNFDKLAHQIKKSLDLRLTVIDKDGVVIAESHKDKSKMDNHRYRDEIMKSDHQKFGYVIRHSNTLDKDLIYIAEKYNYNSRLIYLRLSKELHNIDDQIVSLGLKIFIVLTIFFIAIFITTYKISKQIEQETIKIVHFLKSLTKKDKSTYISSDFSLEFFQITNLLTKVSQILVKKDKQKSKYTNKLQNLNRQKDDIISAISHEFKNPIAVINGYSQTLLDDENINLNIRKKFLTKIYKNGSKLSDLIDTLRLSLKLDSGKQNTNFTSINIYDVVEDCSENVRINYSKRKIIIQGDKNISVKADSSLFSVVVTNLLENGIKYSEDDVYITFDEKGLEVKDSGIGISQKNLENITEKFYRVHNNTWNNSLGLGLFIVNNILKLHNFQLEIKSKENEGSTFSIKF